MVVAEDPIPSPYLCRRAALHGDGKYFMERIDGVLASERVH